MRENTALSVYKTVRTDFELLSYSPFDGFILGFRLLLFIFASVYETVMLSDITKAFADYFVDKTFDSFAEFDKHVRVFQRVSMITLYSIF